MPVFTTTGLTCQRKDKNSSQMSPANAGRDCRELTAVDVIRPAEDQQKNDSTDARWRTPAPRIVAEDPRKVGAQGEARKAPLRIADLGPRS